jgi:hypothetical protein
MFVWAKYTIIAPVFTCFSSIRFQGSKVLDSAFCVLRSGFGLPARRLYKSPEVGGFWLTSTFRNPQSEIRNHLHLASVICLLLYNL